MHLRLLKCPTCEVLYASPALTPEFLANVYREAGYDGNEEAEYAAATYAGQLDSNLRENGAFLRHLHAAGFKQTIGVEPSHEAAAHADEFIRPLIRLGMFRAEDFLPESISLFSCFQTIEHVDSPRGLFLQMLSLGHHSSSPRRTLPCLIVKLPKETCGTADHREWSATIFYSARYRCASALKSIGGWVQALQVNALLTPPLFRRSPG